MPNDKKRKHIKPRFIVFAASIVSLFIFALVYIISQGSVYTTVIPLGQTDFDPKDVIVKVADENILELQSVGFTVEDDFDCLALTYNSKSMGKTTAEVSIPLPDKTYFKLNTFEYYVLPFGVIFDDTTNDFSGCEILFPCFIIYVMIHIIILGISFYKKVSKGIFSYSLVALGGALFYLIGTIFSLILFSFIFTPSFEFHNLDEIMLFFVSNGFLFSSIVFPILIAMAIAVSLSNIWLVKREGFRLFNMLGVLSFLVIIFSFAAIQSMLFHDYSGEAEFKVTFVLFTAFSYTFCYFANMLISTIICSIISVGYKIPHNVDYTIILGCSLLGDGSPTPILRNRIDRAVEFAKEQFSDTGKQTVFVPSGGQGSDEVISEAESMKRYLIAQGIPEEQILIENKSVNTYQNMLFSKNLIESKTEDFSKVNIAFSTTNYHVFRGYTLAEKVGMKAHGLSAKTKLYFYPNAFIREFIGLLVAERRKHIIYLAATVLIYSVLALIFA